MPSLAIKGVAVNFGAVNALKNIDLEVESGSFVTLLGPSGCGKTTLLNVISGFLKPSQGQVFIDDQDVTNAPPEVRDTAMCFQSYALFPHLSVADNIAFGPRQSKVDRVDVQTRVDNLVVLVRSISHHGPRLLLTLLEPPTFTVAPCKTESCKRHLVPYEWIRRKQVWPLFVGVLNLFCAKVLCLELSRLLPSKVLSKMSLSQQGTTLCVCNSPAAMN